MIPEQRIFTSQYSKWAKQTTRNRIIKTELKVQEVENGIILPIKKLRDIPGYDGVFGGGVTTEKYQFVAGHFRKKNDPSANYSVGESYKPEGEPEVSGETVVFGGIFFRHFGHAIIDGLTRMWWYAENYETLPYKLVFLTMPDQSSKTDEIFLQLAGLTKDKYLIVDKPTRFKKILVPDEAVFNLDCGHEKWLEFFDLIKENVKKYTPLPLREEKIYLSRTQLPEKDAVNEEYLESVAKEQGYKIVYPEQLKLEEQIHLIMNAKSIAATMGTLTHLAVFAEPGTELVCFLRKADEITHPQVIINELRKLDWYIVEATKTPLPTTHVRGIFLYGLTPYFADFMRYKKWKFDENYHVSDEMMLEYLKNWADYYSKPQRYVMIRKATIWDTVKGLNWAFYGRTLQEKEYNIAEKKTEPTKKAEAPKPKKEEPQKVGFIRRVWRFIKRKLK